MNGSSRGSSLVEVLLAVAIMGLASTAILGALGTQIAGTAVHRDQSNAAAVVSSAAELIKAVNYDDGCDNAATLDSYQTSARNVQLPSDWLSEKSWDASSAIDVLSVRYWNGSTFTSSCNDQNATDAASLLKLQEIVLRAEGPTGDFEEISVIKAGRP